MFDKILNKRILAYIIDSTIVLLLTLLITNIKYLNPTYDNALEKSNTLQSLNMSNTLIQSSLPIYYNDKVIDADEYANLIKDNEYFGYLIVDAYNDSLISEDEYNHIISEAKRIYNEKAPSIYKEALKANWYTYIVYLVVYFGYFVIFNMITKGITLGKKMTGLQIVSTNNEEATFEKYLVRSLVAYGYFIYLIEIIIPYIIPDEFIVKVAGGLSLFMNILQIVVAINVVSNENHLGLHDILAKTKVIDVKDKVLEAKTLEVSTLRVEKDKKIDEALVKENEVEPAKVNDLSKEENKTTKR